MQEGGPPCLGDARCGITCSIAGGCSFLRFWMDRDAVSLHPWRGVFWECKKVEPPAWETPDVAPTAA